MHYKELPPLDTRKKMSLAIVFQEDKPNSGKKETKPGSLLSWKISNI